MGCDIQYFLDHDFDNLSPEVFLQEFKKRISSVQLYISNSFDDAKSFEDLGIKECWSIYKSEDTNNVQDFLISYYKEGENHNWNISVCKKSLSFVINDRGMTFSPSLRWSLFRDDYLKNRSPEIKSRIDRTIKEIKKNIVPVFHSTKLVAMGDQGLYEILEDELDQGANFDECIIPRELKKKVTM